MGSQMYANLGIHWASTIPAFLALACVPFPFLFYRYGPKIRVNCKYSQQADAFMRKMQNQFQQNDDDDDDEEDDQKDTADDEKPQQAKQDRTASDSDATVVNEEDDKADRNKERQEEREEEEREAIDFSYEDQT